MFFDSTRNQTTMKRFLVPALLVVVCVYAGRAIYHRHLETRLLQTWPDSEAQDPQQLRFAAAVAVPAMAKHCAGCHGADLRGDSHKGSPNLIDKEWIHGEGSVADIEQTINYGIRSGDHRGRDLADTPGFELPVPYRRYQIASLQPADIHDLVEFILQLNHREPIDPAAAAHGALLYRTALCFDCHNGDATGDPSIGAPPLTPHAWLYGDGSRDTLSDIIAYGRRGICPAWFGRLDSVTIRAMALYLHDRSGPS